MNSGNMIGSLGLAAGLTYLFDPDMGRRRRAMIWDQAVHAAHNLRAVAGATASDARQRMRGVAMKFAHLGRRHHEVSDQVLTERVRSKLGRLISYPSAIEAQVQGSQVGLSGPILEQDAKRVLAGVRGIRGVTGCADNLERHESKYHESALQGAMSKKSKRGHWSPTARLLALVGGGAATIYAGRRFMRARKEIFPS